MNPRLQKLRELLVKQNPDAVLISSIANIVYLTNFSEFSTTDRDAYLLITKTKHYVFTHGIYKETVEKQVPHFELRAIQREMPLTKTLQTIIDEQKITKLGYEAFDLKVSEYEQLLKQFNKKMLIPTDCCNKLRVIKSSDEIEKIRKACALGDKAFTFITKQLHAGVTEKELAYALEFFIKKTGADISFPSIVAFDAHTSQPHHVPTTTPLKKNGLVLFDFGVKLDAYCSDMTRIVCFGNATTKQKNVYETVRAAQQKAIACIREKLKTKAEIPATEVDKTARDAIISQGFSTMPHSLGHGIGIEVHEAPRLTPFSQETLEEGMVFSIEPGIYLPKEFGVRIEDLFVVENNKLIQLTNAPKKLIELKI